MKAKIRKKENINKKKILCTVIIVIIALIILIPLINHISKINAEKRKAEELSSFSWESKMFTVNDDYSYTFLCLVTVQEV